MGTGQRRRTRAWLPHQCLHALPQRSDGPRRPVLRPESKSRRAEQHRQLHRHLQRNPRPAARRARLPVPRLLLQPARRGERRPPADDRIPHPALRLLRRQAQHALRAQNHRAGRHRRRQTAYGRGALGAGSGRCAGGQRRVALRHGVRAGRHPVPEQPRRIPLSHRLRGQHRAFGEAAPAPHLAAERRCPPAVARAGPSARHKIAVPLARAGAAT